MDPKEFTATIGICFSDHRKVATEHGIVDDTTTLVEVYLNETGDMGWGLTLPDALRHLARVIEARRRVVPPKEPGT